MIAIGTSAFYVDVAARFQIDFIEQHYGEFGIGILIGLILAFVGCIGWARCCTKQQRASMAAIVFITPLVALLVGSPVDGINIHGPSAITMMLIIPATLLAAILLVMAALDTSEAR